MTALFRRFLSEDDGFILSAELVIIVTVLVIGCITGLASVCSALNNEMNDMANAYEQMSQSYAVGGAIDPNDPYGAYPAYYSNDPNAIDLYGSGYSPLSQQTGTGTRVSSGFSSISGF